MRHIFGFFICFLAIKPFLYKSCHAERCWRHPEELFLPWSLTSHRNFTQQVFGGGRREGDRVGDMVHLWPLCACPFMQLLVRPLVFWGQRWPFCPLLVQPMAQTTLLCMQTSWFLRWWNQWHPERKRGNSPHNSRPGFLGDAHLIHRGRVFSRWALWRLEDEIPRVVLWVQRHPFMLPGTFIYCAFLREQQEQIPFF